MSAAVTPARRLLAMLDDEPSLEIRPRDEIDADLATLGIDPAGPIRLARRLADQSSGPAGALLGAMIDDESAEAEIAALESADIEDVRRQLPAGTVAAVTAEAQRQAGRQSNVVGITRKRRGAVWAWTGSLVGMAACALIVVAAWWPPSELMPSPDLLEAFAPAPELAERRAVPAQSEPQPAELSASSGAAPQSGLGLVTPAAERELAAVATESDRDPEQSRAAVPSSDQEPLGSFRSDGADEVPASLLAEVPQSVPPQIAVAPLEPAGPTSGMLIGRGSDAAAIGGNVTDSPQERAPSGSSAAGEVVLPPLPPPTPARRRMETGDLAGAGSAVEESPPEGSIDALSDSRQEGDYGAVAGARALGLSDIAEADQTRVSAFLIVADPPVAPPTGQFLFSDSGAETKEGALSARLADATHAAEGRKILALAGLEGPEEAYDVVIVLRDPSSGAPPGEPLTPGLAALFGDRAALLEQIKLPPR